MAIERWNPRQDYTKQEEVLMHRLRRTRKLFAFLRAHRHELFDDPFQAELESVYRDTGAGKPPIPPAVLAMVTLLQAYLGVSDAEAVELTVVDIRWQMVLECLGATEPAFSQGALCEFRERLIRTNLDRRLLERTVALARRTKEFDARKLPKTLRVAMDSSALEGAGRVEDTLNLLAHAAGKIVGCVAELLGWPQERVCREAGIPLLLQPGVKKALDVDWTHPEAQLEALQRLVKQLDSLEAWVQRRLPQPLANPPLKERVETLEQLRHQDLEPDPKGSGVRIREGVAPERRISIEDPQMRHGRKSQSQLFNGYKRHLATSLDDDLILACAITPANRPEQEATVDLKTDIDHQGLPPIGELYIDRGYIGSPVVDEVLGGGGEVICRPWGTRNGQLFSKGDFKLNLREMTLTCPAGHTEPFRLGLVVEFDPEVCAGCPLRSQCTTAAPGRGRTVTISEGERLQQRLRKLVATRKGRQRLRKRVKVEHRLAHLGRRQGRRARYKGKRKNLFDARRTAVVLNLQTIQRRTEEQELQKAA